MMIKFRLNETKFFEGNRFGFDCSRTVMWQNEDYVSHDEFEKSLRTLAPKCIDMLEPLELPAWQGDDGNDGKGEKLLLLCWGGLGDLISMHPLLHYIKENYEFDLVGMSVPSMKPDWFVGGLDVTIEYPPMLSRILPFDRFVMFENIFPDTLKRELVDIFVERLGLDFLSWDQKRPKLYPSPELREYVRGLLPKPRGKCIGIHIKGTVEERSIPVAKAWALANSFADAGHTAILLGKWPDFSSFKRDKEDKKIAFRELREGVYNFCGLLNGEEEITALVSILDFFIGPDSGLLHVAGAQDIPGLGIFTTYSSDIRLGYYPTIEGVNADPKHYIGDRETFFPEDSARYEAAVESIDWDSIVKMALERLGG